MKEKSDTTAKYSDAASSLGELEKSWAISEAGIWRTAHQLFRGIHTAQASEREPQERVLTRWGKKGAPGILLACRAMLLSPGNGVSGLKALAGCRWNRKTTVVYWSLSMSTPTYVHWTLRVLFPVKILLSSGWKQKLPKWFFLDPVMSSSYFRWKKFFSSTYWWKNSKPDEG